MAGHVALFLVKSGDGHSVGRLSLSLWGLLKDKPIFLKGRNDTGKSFFI